MKVLIVDDDAEIRLIAGHLLREAGHDVREATSVMEASIALGAGSFDLVLIDVMLGTDDGVAAAEAMIAGPFAFLTGATRADQHARMSATRAAGIIHKPFDPGTFVATVEQLVRGDG